MKTQQKLETLNHAETCRKVCLSFATRMRGGFNFNGVFMKILLVAFLLFILSCKDEVETPTTPIIPQHESSDNPNWDFEVPYHRKLVFSRPGNPDLTFYRDLNDIHVGSLLVDNYIGMNGSLVATQDWVIKSAITFGTSEQKTFNRVDQTCRELIINGEKTGMYVLIPDK